VLEDNPGVQLKVMQALADRLAADVELHGI
jgi:hypothetical protein